MDRSARNRRISVFALAFLFSLGMIAAGSAAAEQSGGMHYVRIPAKALPDTAVLGLRPQLDLDYGAFAWQALSSDELARLKASGTEFDEMMRPYTLRLGEVTFDPAAAEPGLPDGWTDVRDDVPDMHLVQFQGPVRAEWLDGLRSSGFEIVQYIHPFTYIVWGQETARSPLAGNTAVRWSGGFAPAFRVQPRFRALDDEKLAVRILLYRGADTDAAVSQIKALGGKFDGRTLIDNILEQVIFELPGSSIQAVSQIPGVYSVKRVPTDGGLRGEMSDQVCVNNVDGSSLAFPGYPAWLSSVGLDGTGVIMANVDGGIQQTHTDLVNRMLPCTGTTCGGSASSSHGTHTAGIMAADGSSGVLDAFGFLRGLGMAPGANLVEQVYSPWYSQVGGLRLLMKDSYNSGASLSSNSWGPSGSPHGYDDDTRQVDVGVRDTDDSADGNQPLSYVLSFMNGYGGTSTQGTPDEAKNLFNIGSTKMQTSSGTQILQIDDLSSNSAHGPALDGRTIPHMVAPGCYVDSTFPADSYGMKCGTSMASPHVSGAVALFIEYYRGLPGGPPDPSPALIKAAFLPVAHDLAGHLDADGGTLGHPFDSKQGWGRMDVPAVVDPQVTVRYFDDPTIFDNTGEEWTWDVSAADPTQPMRIMLVWTDAPGHGLGGSTPAWNNDLDLVVEDGADTYRGNNFGASGWSTMGGSADGMNNTEGVFIGPTAPGAYTIRVIAGDINSDGVPNQGDDTDQDFALVCYNCAQEEDFTLIATPSEQDICAPADAVYTVDIGQFAGYSDPVNLTATGAPAGTTVDFSVDPVTPPGSSTLTIGNTGAASPGSYVIDVIGSSTSGTHSFSVKLKVYTDVPGGFSLSTPVDGAEGVTLIPTFSWTAASQASSYDIEIATDAGFASIVDAATVAGPNYTPESPLASDTPHYWRVRAQNPCGTGGYTAAFTFTTLDTPSILLVDDDDNAPDVRSYYTDALDALGEAYDVWDTNNSDNEPNDAELASYQTVIWFTGDEWGGAAGPGSAGEAALAAWLDRGGCLFISSQDYYLDRGLTSLMTDYLGISGATGDVSQTTATGTGPVFGGRGPYTLSYPFTNYSDQITVGADAELAFDGDQGNAAADKDSGLYKTTFWAFPFEAVASAADRNDLMATFLAWCPSSVTECQTTPGDMDGDSDVDGEDIQNFVGCYISGSPAEANCACGDMASPGVFDAADVASFVDCLMGVACP